LTNFYSLNNSYSGKKTRLHKILDSEQFILQRSSQDSLQGTLQDTLQRYLDLRQYLHNESCKDNCTNPH
jgi:hypothetical protein